jgi:hypothetical protein
MSRGMAKENEVSITVISALEATFRRPSLASVAAAHVTMSALRGGMPRRLYGLSLNCAPDFGSKFFGKSIQNQIQIDSELI